MVFKLRLILLFIVLIPQVVMFSLTHDTSLANDKQFNQAEALSLASAFLATLVLPGIIIEGLICRPFNIIKAFCSQLKQGNYAARLTVPNECTNGEDEDDIVGLMRNMNWMARQIEIRENELSQAIERLQESRHYIETQNTQLLQMNGELIQTQQGLQKQTEELLNAYQQMRLMAMTDSLTKIANRRYFFDSLNEQFQTLAYHCQPMSLLMMDVDHFKKINDTYGHENGDKVLREIAEIIRENTRTKDLPARVGGEEYAVLLAETSSAEAIAIADRIKKAVAARVFVTEDQKSLLVTISVGVCTLSRVPCLQKNCLYTFADRALYFSKNNGRNSISVFDPITGLINKAECA